MNHGLTSETADRIRSVLARFPQVEKAVLYGSRAKGNYKRGSDIDLTLFGSGLNASVLSQISSGLDDLQLARDARRRWRYAPASSSILCPAVGLPQGGMI